MGPNETELQEEYEQRYTRSNHQNTFRNINVFCIKREETKMDNFSDQNILPKNEKFAYFDQ